MYVDSLGTRGPKVPLTLGHGSKQGSRNKVRSRFKRVTCLSTRSCVCVCLFLSTVVCLNDWKFFWGQTDGVVRSPFLDTGLLVSVHFLRVRRPESTTCTSFETGDGPFLVGTRRYRWRSRVTPDTRCPRTSFWGKREQGPNNSRFLEDTFKPSLSLGFILKLCLNKINKTPQGQTTTQKHHRYISPLTIHFSSL